jgi:hypothetical protein
MSPFRVSLLDFVDHFSASPERRAILRGFLAFRGELRSFGLQRGFQWLDGSFVENIDRVRPPNDVDVVTFSHRPPSMTNDHVAFRTAVQARPGLFRPQLTKASFSCDAYFVDLDSPDASWLVSQTRYWFGLFSHTRNTLQWKGLVEVPFGQLDDDSIATKILDAKDKP